MQPVISKTITSNDKLLVVTAVSFSGIPISDTLLKAIKDAFFVLSPFIKDKRQVLYLRDLPSFSIDGKYPNGHCYNRHEAMISLPKWKTANKYLVATINHELHHLARWQNAGYGSSLGGAILSEGVATLYEELKSHWISPWSRAVFTKDILEDAIKNWDNTSYNHKDWFFESKRGRWLGYSIGYHLAQELFKNGFDLEKSLIIKPEDVKRVVFNLHS